MGLRDAANRAAASVFAEPCICRFYGVARTDSASRSSDLQQPGNNGAADKVRGEHRDAGREAVFCAVLRLQSAVVGLFSGSV